MKTPFFSTFLLPASLLLTSLLPSFCTAAFAQEWTQFRGPNASGLSPTAIPTKWTAENTAWKVALPGSGHGSPVLWGDRIFLLCADEKSGNRIMCALKATDGSLRWKTEAQPGTHKKHKFNSFASTTAAVDKDRVYFSWGTKEQVTVTALDHEGKQQWQRDLPGVVEGHGFGASPVLYQDLVLLNRDQKGSGALFALDAATGNIRWKIDRKSQRLSYSCPIVYQAPGREKELVFTNWQHGMTGVDPQTGKVTWEKSVYNTDTNERAISTPVVAGDLVIGICGFTKYPKHCVALKVEADGTVNEVWRQEKTIPHIPCPIVHGDYIYLWEDNAILVCRESQTGKLIYKERVPGTVYFGSPVIAGDKLFCIDRDGIVAVVKLGAEFELLATNELDELCRSTPAIANGRMFIRTHKHLIAIGN